MTGKHPAPHRILAVAALIAIAFYITPRVVSAQLDQVYGWETPQQGWFETTLLSSYIARSEQRYTHFGSDVPTQGLLRTTGELEYGFTDRFSGSLYADFDRPKDLGLNYIQARANVRYRFSDKYSRLMDPALYLEYYVPREKYGGAERLEMRLILERDLNDFRLDVNPIITRAMSGDSVQMGTQAELQSRVVYRRFFAIQPGIELHSDFGPLRAFEPTARQSHILVPTVDVQFQNGLIWHLAAGFGLTNNSDKLTLHTYLTYEFQTVRPSSQPQ